MWKETAVKGSDVRRCLWGSGMTKGNLELACCEELRGHAGGRWSVSTARGQREGEGLWREKRLQARMGPSENPPLQRSSQLPGGLVKTQAARLHPRSLCFSRSEFGPTVCPSSHSDWQLHSFEIHLPTALGHPDHAPQPEPGAQEHQNWGASLCSTGAASSLSQHRRCLQ